MRVKKKQETTIDGLEKTVDNLAVSIKKGFKATNKKMEAGFKKSDERLEKAVNNLAMMIGKGFEQVDKRFENIDEKIDDLKRDNAREHEEIKLRQDEVPYRFELVELQKRVEALEERNSIKIV